MAGKRRGTESGTVQQAQNGSDLAESAGYAVRQTHQAFLKALERRLRTHGITTSSWFFLRRLWEKEGCTQKELGDQLGLTQPTTVSAMDTLEKAGFVVRKRNPRDRRKLNVMLTKKGRALKAKLLPYAVEVNAVALQDLSESEVQQLLRVLKKIRDALEGDQGSG